MLQPNIQVINSVAAFLLAILARDHRVLTHSSKQARWTARARKSDVKNTNRSPDRPAGKKCPLSPPYCTHDSVHAARPAPVELEYVPAMQAVHAEDPAESHPGAPRRIRAAVTAIQLAAATASGSSANVHARCLPCRSPASSAYINPIRTMPA